MTKTTKAEQIQAIYDLKVGYTLGHADIAMLKAIARQLLSGLEQEPVDTFYKSECGNVFNTLDSWLPVEGVNKLYAAPQLPQPAVPDEWIIQDAVKFCRDTGRQDAGAAMAGWNACRAAMLQDSEPVTDNTNQQFESLSRGDK